MKRKPTHVPFSKTTNAATCVTFVFKVTDCLTLKWQMLW